MISWLYLERDFLFSSLTCHMKTLRVRPKLVNEDLCVEINMPTILEYVCLPNEAHSTGWLNHDMRAHTVRKKPVGSRCPARLLTIVKTYWCDSSEARLFTCNNVTEAEVCPMLCVKTQKKKKALMHMDSQMAWETWTVWPFCREN